MTITKKTERPDIKKSLDIPVIRFLSWCLIISVVSLFCIFASSGISHAATLPGYERLQPVTNYVTAPTAVALDHNECLFVAESVNNQVLIFSQSGQYLEKISGLEKPISVAVDSNVRVYVGNKDGGNVEVYDADYNYLFKLGTGDGEFIQPNDIAIDSTGKIYVVDRGEHKVKIYNSDGTYNTSFGSEGNGNGEFYHPTSIVINQPEEELIVLDRQLSQDMFGDYVEGARIQLFDMTGAFKSSFSKYGDEIGEMFRPQHVTVDNQGRLYVTDSFHNVVIVYDSDGTYLGDVYDTNNPLRTPLGIMIGESGRLFIASLQTEKVEVYGIDAYTDMTVTPLNLNFQGQDGGSNPAVQSVAISNTGTLELNWSASINGSWIALSESSGAVAASGTTAIDVGASLNGMTEGTYTGSISVSAASGATERVDVVFEVLPPAELSATPASLIFNSTNGSNPSAQALTVTNNGGGVLSWTAAKDRAWMSIDKVLGTAPDSIAVSVDTASLAVGTYAGSVTVTGEGALSSPTVIPVTLNIVEVTGTINVTSNIEDATFTINGPQSYSGSGANWTAADAFAGTYAIVYGDVDGYTTPLSQSQLLETAGNSPEYYCGSRSWREQCGSSEGFQFRWGRNRTGICSPWIWLWSKHSGWRYK
jgi:sugar lactone lactonase YvrE